MPAREARILRDRQAAFEDALDAAAQASESRPFASARLLVQIYNGGSMPSSPDLWYFTHPVLAYGAETEGGAATFSVDTATTVPVIVLGGVPSVGDYLTAYSVGGRWVAEKKGCSITVNVKCGATNVSGDTVTLLYGMTTITSGTTNSSGNVTLAVPLPLTNPYTITATGGGNPDFSTGQPIACGGTYDYNVCLERRNVLAVLDPDRRLDDHLDELDYRQRVGDANVHGAGDLGDGLLR